MFIFTYRFWLLIFVVLKLISVLVNNGINVKCCMYVLTFSDEPLNKVVVFILEWINLNFSLRSSRLKIPGNVRRATDPSSRRRIRTTYLLHPIRLQMETIDKRMSLFPLIYNHLKGSNNHTKVWMGKICPTYQVLDNELLYYLSKNTLQNFNSQITVT